MKRRWGGPGERCDPAGEERGSILPLLAIVFGAVGLSLALTVVIAGHGVRSAGAQWAADAAALAEAAEPGSGSAVARANGARVVSVERVDGPAGSHPAGPPGGGAGRWTGPIPMSPVVVIEVERAGLRARAAAAAYALEKP